MSIGRAAIAALIALIGAIPACAEVWMVKRPDVIACEHRQTLVDLDSASSPSKAGSIPHDCLMLYSGERLLEQPQAAQGFNKYLKVERGDGALLFVRNTDLVLDPGIGSVEADR